MRSYEAARSLFSFLGVVAWIIIGIGGIVAMVGIVAVSESASYYGRSPSGEAILTALLPGSYARKLVMV